MPATPLMSGYRPWQTALASVTKVSVELASDDGSDEGVDDASDEFVEVLSPPPQAERPPARVRERAAAATRRVG